MEAYVCCPSEEIAMTHLKVLTFFSSAEKAIAAREANERAKGNKIFKVVFREVLERGETEGT